MTSQAKLKKSFKQRSNGSQEKELLNKLNLQDFLQKIDRTELDRNCFYATQKLLMIIRNLNSMFISESTSSYTATKEKGIDPIQGLYPNLT